MSTWAHVHACAHRHTHSLSYLNVSHLHSKTDVSHNQNYWSGKNLMWGAATRKGQYTYQSFVAIVVFLKKKKKKTISMLLFIFFLCFSFEQTCGQANACLPERVWRPCKNCYIPIWNTRQSSQIGPFILTITASVTPLPPLDIAVYRWILLLPSFSLLVCLSIRLSVCFFIDG